MGLNQISLGLLLYKLQHSPPFLSFLWEVVINKYLRGTKHLKFWVNNYLDWKNNKNIFFKHLIEPSKIYYFLTNKILLKNYQSILLNTLEKIVSYFKSIRNIISRVTIRLAFQLCIPLSGDNNIKWALIVPYFYNLWKIINFF